MDWWKAWSNEPERPETQQLSDGAFRLWHDGRCYIAHTESDGFIPGTQLPRFGRHGSARNANALIGQGLWEATPTGYIDLRWETEQETQATLEAKREAGRRRQERWRNGASNAASNGVTNGEVTEQTRGRGREEGEREREVISPEEGPLGFGDLFAPSLRVVGHDL